MGDNITDWGKWDNEFRCQRTGLDGSVLDHGKCEAEDGWAEDYRLLK
ncbi:MAG: hypothetical protein ABSD29_09480 [Verrucomicrobiota bacterium]